MQHEEKQQTGGASRKNLVFQVQVQEHGDGFYFQVVSRQTHAEHLQR